MENGKTGSLVAFWRESAQYDYGVAKVLFEKTKYPYALFFCHLCLEKTLKGLVVKITGKPADPIHNLVLLAKKTDLLFTEEQVDFFTVVSQFNIQARYQGYKSAFYKQATKTYTKEYLFKTEAMLQWLTKKF
jgi:HEPN domain-containing protein